MPITVIIPCLNEQNYIGQLLGDISRQTLKPEAVYVVDNGSTDSTVGIAGDYLSKLPLTILKSEPHNAGAARNEGASKAKTDFLLFLDADMRIKDDFIEELTDRQKTTGADFVSPRFKTEGHHPMDMLVTWCMSKLIHIQQLIFRNHVFGIGGGMLVRKRNHDAAGGYDTKIREFDDIYYCSRLAKVGTKARYCNKAVAIASNRRFVEQGRVATIIQMLPDNFYLVRRIVRPYMKKRGIPPKWPTASSRL